MAPEAKTTVSVGLITEWDRNDLNDLCDATDAAILDGGGFGWLQPPERSLLERYWKGVLVVPERSLYCGRVDGVIAGSAQIVQPSKQNEAQALVANITTMFVAPWARGYGLARLLLTTVIAEARKEGLKILNLDVRESQTAAIRLYESLGFVQWGAHPYYAFINGRAVPGRYYFYDLDRGVPDSM